MRYIVIMTTCASKREAEMIAGELFDKRLIACANISGEVESRFRWEGRVDSAGEWLLIMKSVRGAFSAVERTIRRMHSYDVPEVIAVPILCGSRRYLAWIDESVRLKARRVRRGRGV